VSNTGTRLIFSCYSHNPKFSAIIQFASRRPSASPHQPSPSIYRRSVLPDLRFPVNRCLGFADATRRSDSDARPCLFCLNCFRFASFATLCTCSSLRKPFADGVELQAICDEFRRFVHRVVLSERPRFKPVGVSTCSAKAQHIL